MSNYVKNMTTDYKESHPRMIAYIEKYPHREDIELKKLGHLTFTADNNIHNKYAKFPFMLFDRNNRNVS